jgi:tetratricopeptide (TPR) repeat protein
MIRSTLIFTLIFACSSLFAQHDQKTLQLLAKQAKNKGELEQAISYYEDLYKQNEAELFYEELFELYVETTNFKEAEKLVKKRIKKYPARATYLVDRGQLNELQGNPKAADQDYREALKIFDGSTQYTRPLAAKFARYDHFDYSEAVYLKSRKVTGDDRLYQFDLANTFAQQGKTVEMIDEYLSVVGGNRGYLQTIQNLFHRVLHPDPDGSQSQILKERILKKLQDNDPRYDNTVYSELLIWLYIQEKNLKGALVQAKALDKRADENGKRVFNLAELARANGEFAIAEEAYAYTEKLGENSPYYLSSKIKLVDVKRDRLFADNNYSREDLEQLRSEYLDLLDDLGKSAYTLQVIFNLAELNAYYLDDIEAGEQLLQEVLVIKSVTDQDKAEAKIALADLMLLKGEIWEASLLYSQVEKSFKYDRLGEIAKFKNAKIAFYTGDFYWAQAQLDVLKGSTSKLIANDAMDLSLTITDNIGLDSIAEPLEMYARADLLLFKKDYKQALNTLDSIPKYFPLSSLKDEVFFKKYEIAYEQKQYQEARSQLEQLIAAHAEDILGDDALFYLAELHEKHLQAPEKAMELYKSLITTYPSSMFVVESRKRFRALRGDKQEEAL